MRLTERGRKTRDAVLLLTFSTLFWAFLIVCYAVGSAR